MHFGLLCILCVCTYSAAQNVVPAGFIPLPPLPVNSNIFQSASTPKATQPKPTAAPVTKKPTATKAPYQPSTPRSSLPPSSRLPTSQRATSSQPPCGMNINVPNANCKGGNSLVQQTLNTLKQELTKTRQQHQAQDAAVQATITKLQVQQSGYLNKISDLQNEVKNLVMAFNSLSGARPVSTAAPVSLPPSVPGSGVSNTFIQQALQNVRDDMSKAVTEFNGKVFNLSSLMVTNQQQESKNHQSIESKIQQQAQEIGRLQQQVIDLNRLLQQLNTSTGAPGTGASKADVAKLEAQVQQVAADIKAYDQRQKSQFSSLNLKTSSLQLKVNNHTSQMQGLKTSLLVSQSRINKVDKDITVVHDALANFRKLTLPKMNTIENDVNDLKRNISTVSSTVHKVDKSVFNLFQQITTDSGKLISLEKQAKQLQTDIGRMQTDLTSQSNEITSIKSGMTSLKNAIPIKELDVMNNSVLDVLNAITQGKQPSKQQLQGLTNSITTLKNQIGKLGSVVGPSG